MLKKMIDKPQRFVSVFNPNNGFYIRTGVLDRDGRDTGEDPFMASFPQLIDIGIMGHCVHGASGLCLKSGVQCYQSGSVIKEPNMKLTDYKKIIDQCRNKTFQVALGGRGDPDQHENFEEILAYSKVNGVVPNFTTSGFGFSKDKASLCKKYCGAVAVSWYKHKHTYSALEMLLEADVKTNIHFVLGRNSIQEAIDLITRSGFPSGINAVVFLLHKPVGLGRKDNLLTADNPLVEKFFNLIDSVDAHFKVGFDSCTIPALIQFNSTIDYRLVDTCEGARFSCYITPDLKMLPCSFDQNYLWSYDLMSGSMIEGWNSPQFEDFRNRLKQACPECETRLSCMGGCPIEPVIVICNRSEKSSDRGVP